MIAFLKKIKNHINKIDNCTTKNKFVSNPFTKLENKTYVWLEKSSVFETIFKIKY